MTEFVEVVEFKLDTDDLHDVILPFVEDGDSILSDKYLIALFKVLPFSVKQIAYAWGSGDTEFREAMYDYYLERPDFLDTKRLDIWLEEQASASK